MEVSRSDDWGSSEYYEKLECAQCVADGWEYHRGTFDPKHGYDGSWRKRPTPEEQAQTQAREQERHEEVEALRDEWIDGFIAAMADLRSRKEAYGVLDEARCVSYSFAEFNRRTKVAGPTAVLRDIIAPDVETSTTNRRVSIAVSAAAS